MKLCRTCGLEKELDQFANNKTKKDGKHDKCRECKKAYNREYYKKTKDIHNPSRFARRIQIRNEMQSFLLDYLKENPCIDCGITNPIVLQFDHRDDVEKLFNIADCLRNQSMKRMLAEIEKCDVRCANCHAIRTAKQQGWYKNVGL